MSPILERAWMIFKGVYAEEISTFSKIAMSFIHGINSVIFLFDLDRVFLILKCNSSLIL